MQDSSDFKMFPIQTLMKKLIIPLLGTLVLVSNLSAQNRTLLATDPLVYAVC